MYSFKRCASSSFSISDSFPAVKSTNHRERRLLVWLLRKNEVRRMFLEVCACRTSGLQIESVDGQFILSKMVMIVAFDDVCESMPAEVYTITSTALSTP